MIISRTPFRVSFFGGGTDYPDWYLEHGGGVLATTIDKYCYITCRYLPPFFNHRSRIVWSEIEQINNLDEIRHPSVKGTLSFLNMNDGLEIHHDGDLPARSGLGSSSSFTVGLLNSLKALRGSMSSKYDLANEAIEIEQNILSENVGSQDQIAAAYGGFNTITFETNGNFSVHPVIMPIETTLLLEDSLLLFFTGQVRNASEIAKHQIEATPKLHKELNTMHEMVAEAKNILTRDRNIDEFGELLHESWLLKRTLTEHITNNYIDEIYNTAIRAGAIGGKLLGAGGGGFMLFYAKPEAHASIKASLRTLLNVPFKFEQSGSQIIFYDPPKNYEAKPNDLGTKEQCYE